MAGEYEVSNLGSVANVRSGYAFRSDDMGNIGCPIIKIKNVVPPTIDVTDCERVPDHVIAEIPNVERYALQSGDVLIAMTGATVGKVGRFPLTRERFYLNQRVGKVYLTKPSKADYRFLYYVLSQTTHVRQMFGAADGSAQANISGAQIERLEVPLPPLPEQRGIAHILGTLDDKIDLNRRLNETLEEMARALFKSWFVDFDPVRAKAAGRDPGLPKHIADLFPACLVDSELGEIPEGWEVGTFSDVAEHPRRGVQPDQIEPNTPYIALEHMPKHSIALSNWGTAEGLESNKFEFKTSEILFGKLRPYFHKVGVAPVDGVCSTDIVVIAPKFEHWFGFVLGHASSDAFVKYTNATSTGTKMPRTSWGDMARYALAIPPKPIGEAFTRQVRPVVGRIISEIHESRTLASLRDTLLPKVISGEMRVKYTEQCQ